jgi:hypothetical protein
MSPSHTRLLAIGIAAIVAVLTAAATAVVGGGVAVPLIALCGALASAGGAVLVWAGAPGPVGPPVPVARRPVSAAAAGSTMAGGSVAGGSVAGGSVAAGGPAPLGGPGGPPAADRAALIRACIYVRDRLTSVALAERLDRALCEAGVRPVAPVGERFDPAVHEAGGAVPAPDAHLVGTVAAVEAPGYTDRGVPLRPPVVTVYQADYPADPARTRRLP